MTTGTLHRGVLAVVLAVFAALPLGCPAAAQPAKPQDDPVVATVNGEKIFASDLELARRYLPAEMQQFPGSVMFGLLVNTLIDAKLAAAAARAEGLDRNPAVKRELNSIDERILQRAYLRHKIESEITEAALKERYQRYVRENAGDDELHARHILVKTEAEAVAIIVDLDKGADFAELARRRSTGPSAPDGGDLGFMSRAEMVPEFADAAFALADRETTRTPVKTSFGWHVIRVEERRKGKPPMFEQIEGELRDALMRETAAATLRRLRDTAEIKQFLPDGSEASGGQGGSGK